jgi:hypothetical protein
MGRIWKLCSAKRSKRGEPEMCLTGGNRLSRWRMGAARSMVAERAGSDCGARQRRCAQGEPAAHMRGGPPASTAHAARGGCATEGNLHPLSHASPVAAPCARANGLRDAAHIDGDHAADACTWCVCAAGAERSAGRVCECECVCVTPISVGLTDRRPPAMIVAARAHRSTPYRCAMVCVWCSAPAAPPPVHKLRRNMMG